ncbi:MAG: single-stranded DNA-binding protein [Prevotella sp.]|nr:single-stranded DNA-binding protein [Prevotella sp.]
MNKVILIGNVGLDPEVRYYEADSCVARVRLATTEKGYVLQNGTRVPDRTDWHNLVFYRKLAKVVDQYVHKGDKLYVDGRLQYTQYDDKRGIQRTAVEIIVDNMEMLTPKALSQGNAPTAQSSAEPAPQQEPSSQQQKDDDTVIPF